MNDDLALALQLADEADALTMARFRARDLVVDTKPDLTPVSEADRAVEEAMRRRLARARPGHGVVGEEEGGRREADAGWRWVLDPIDGTKNYVRGVPVWATLIALQRDGESVVGVVSAPGLGRRWWAARGEGAFAAGAPARVSAVGSLADVHLSYPSAAEFDGLGLTGAVLDLERRCWRARGLGDFWAHALVAEGALDVAVEPEVALWDFAAVQLLVEEAGGRFTDVAGAAPVDGGSALSTNGLVHGDVVAALAGSARPPR